MKMVKVSTTTFRDAMEEGVGWCTVCEDFTRRETESDAEGYDCPVCKNNTVSGAELSLIQGDIQVVEMSGGRTVGDDGV
jgi:Zn finger protein HypA/HybF involved in hydrogenase expression